MLQVDNFQFWLLPMSKIHMQDYIPLNQKKAWLVYDMLRVFHMSANQVYKAEEKNFAKIRGQILLVGILRLLG